MLYLYYHRSLLRRFFDFEDLCVTMATGEPNFFGNSYDKLIFLQKWTRSTLLHQKFQRIVREAAAIKIQNLLSRNKDYKQGKVVLANKKNRHILLFTPGSIFNDIETPISDVA